MEQGDHIQFIRSLEVEAPSDPINPHESDPTKPYGAKELPPNHKPQGYVGAECSISFTNLLMGQQKADVLNSTLLAKLAANKQYQFTKQPKEWYAFYKSVLQQVGWVIQDFNFQEYTSSSASFTISKVVHEVLAPIANTDQVVVLEKSLKELQSLPKDDHRVSLFYNHSCLSKPGSFVFQFQLCTEHDSGQVVMVLASFYFKSKVKCTSFLFQEFHSRDIQLEYAIQTITLNAVAYTAVRADIVKKLSGHQNSFLELF